MAALPWFFIALSVFFFLLFVIRGMIACHKRSKPKERVTELPPSSLEGESPDGHPYRTLGEVEVAEAEEVLPPVLKTRAEKLAAKSEERNKLLYTQALATVNKMVEKALEEVVAAGAYTTLVPVYDKSYAKGVLAKSGEYCRRKKAAEAAAVELREEGFGVKVIAESKTYEGSAGKNFVHIDIALK